MKRFLLFQGDYYYPLGGWNDFTADFDTFDEALKYAHDNFVGWGQWWHIVDTQERREVASSGA